METNRDKKDFDCIAMKNEIQAKVYADIKDMTLDERLAYFRIPLEQDPFRKPLSTGFVYTK